MNREMIFLHIFAGLCILAIVAALPFYAKTAMSVPSILTMCGTAFN